MILASKDIIQVIMKASQRQYLIVTTFLVMLIMAVVSSTKGILIPTFKSEFNLSDTAAGTFLTICSLTYMIVTYFGGMLCSKIGQKKIILLGLLMGSLGTLGIAYATSFFQVIAAYIILNIGTAAMAIGMNTVFPLLKVAYIGVLMNSLHAFFGVGSTITQKVTGYLLFTGVEWQLLFKVYTALFLITMVLYAFVKQPEFKVVQEKQDQPAIKSKSLLVAFSLALGFYVASEMQTGNWLLNYLKEVHHMNSNNGATYVALFFGIFSLGRFLGGFVAEKIGYMNAIVKSMTIALVLYVLGLTIGGKGLYLVSLSGLFFAIIFPTFLIVAQNTFTNNPTHATGIITTAASAIAMIIGYLLGVLNDTIGPAMAIYIVPISMICCIILMTGIKKTLESTKEPSSLAVETIH